MTNAPTPAELSKGQNDNTNNATKNSITQRLRTDLGRSVGVTMATQLVWLTWSTGPTFPLPAKAVQSKGHTCYHVLSRVTKVLSRFDDE